VFIVRIYKKNHVSYSALTESCRILVYVLQNVIYMVRCIL